MRMSENAKNIFSGGQTSARHFYGVTADPCWSKCMWSETLSKTLNNFCIAMQITQTDDRESWKSTSRTETSPDYYMCFDYMFRRLRACTHTYAHRNIFSCGAVHYVKCSHRRPLSRCGQKHACLDRFAMASQPFARRRKPRGRP